MKSKIDELEKKSEDREEEKTRLELDKNTDVLKDIGLVGDLQPG